MTSSGIDKMFENFEPIFEQNEKVNFGPICVKYVNFVSFFEKKCKFRTFCQWQMTSLLGCISAPHKKQD